LTRSSTLLISGYPSLFENGGIRWASIVVNALYKIQVT
jgi:hypothetical protein